MNIPSRSIKTVIRKCKDVATGANLPRKGCLPKLKVQTASIRETTMTPKITLMGPGRSSAEMGGTVRRISTSCKELGFMEKWPKKVTA